jgi:simple sugar transport system permease protein
MSAAEVILESASRLSIPLMAVALGEYVAERGGAVNLSVEGMMLAGAYGGAAGSYLTNAGVAGLAVGAMAGAAVALFQAQLSHRASANQFVVGVALNILVLGLTSYLFVTYRTPSVSIGTKAIPGLADIPVLGSALFNQSWPLYLIYPLIPAIWWIIQRSRWGLELRAAGESPEAASMAGIDVNRRRRHAIMLCGILAGYGGAVLSVAIVGTFQQNMTAGRGFLALAAVVFGGWTIRGTIAGCILFGGADALRLALPALGIEVNSQMLIAAPYIFALIAMLVFATRFRPPASLGLQFTGRRA